MDKFHVCDNGDIDDDDDDENENCLSRDSSRVANKFSTWEESNCSTFYHFHSEGCVVLEKLDFSKSAVRLPWVLLIVRLYPSHFFKGP